MQEIENNSNKDLEKIDEDINFHRIIIFLIIIAVIFFYLIMKEVAVTEVAQHWGTVGDFFGGILNPIFALFAFYWLTYSVRLQIKELKETREELKKAASAQVESARHQESIARLEAENVETQSKILELNKETLRSQKDAAIAQAQQIAIQNFESLFFQLLKTKTDVTNDILVGSKNTLLRLCTVDIEEVYSLEKEKESSKKINQMIRDRVQGKESIKDHLIIFKSHVLKSWESFYKECFLDYAGSYFRVSYQIVKLINQNETLGKLPKFENKKFSIKQKEYFDIFRATFTQYELEAFFYNCLSKYGNVNFKSLLEDYGMFEPLLLDTDRPNERINSLTRFAYMYDESIFEKNDSWQKYFADIKMIKESIDIKSIKEELFFLWRMKLIINPSNEVLLGGDEVLLMKYGFMNDFFNAYFIWAPQVNSINIHNIIKNTISGITVNLGKLKSEIADIKNSNLEDNHIDKNEQDKIQEINKNEELLNKYKNLKSLEQLSLILKYGIRLNEFSLFFQMEKE